MQRNSLIIIDTEKDLDQVILFLNLLSDGLGDIATKNQYTTQKAHEITDLLNTILEEQKLLFKNLCHDCLFTKGVQQEDFDLVQFLNSLLDAHPNSQRLKKAYLDVQISIEEFKKYQKFVIQKSNYVNQIFDI